MAKFRWGVFGTGPISAKFVAGLARLPDAEVTMVASRDQGHADAFARTLNIPHPIAGYDIAAARASDLVDAMYIATPPALHLDHARMCLSAGIPVLIEKPLAATAAETDALVAAAKSGGIFCMEAMWTRFLPALSRLRALVRDGAIGEPRVVSGSFGTSYAVDPDHGNFDPARGGGALAHLGFYPVSIGQWLFGTPADAHALGHVGATGVEEDAAIMLRYASGVIASFHTSLRAPAANDLSVEGTHGRIQLRGPIYRPWGLTIERTAPQARSGGGAAGVNLRKEGHLFQRIGQLRDAAGRGAGHTERHFFDGNGYGHEAAEVAACVREGRTESAVMPLADSIAVGATLERLRRDIRSGGETL